jgi:Coenzyme PQQ synthesis protein D (PqqD)
MHGRLTRDPALKTSVLPDGHIVVHSKKTNRAFTLTPLAGIVWEFCDGSHTVSDIVSALSNMEGLPAVDNREQEIAALVNELIDSGVLIPEEE